jgi:hypothetical protein
MDLSIIITEFEEIPPDFTITFSNIESKIITNRYIAYRSNYIRTALTVDRQNTIEIECLIRLKKCENYVDLLKGYFLILSGKYIEASSYFKNLHDLLIAFLFEDYMSSDVVKYILSFVKISYIEIQPSRTLYNHPKLDCADIARLILEYTKIKNFKFRTEFWSSFTKDTQKLIEPELIKIGIPNCYFSYWDLV